MKLSLLVDQTSHFNHIADHEPPSKCIDRSTFCVAKYIRPIGDDVGVFSSRFDPNIAHLEDPCISEVVATRLVRLEHPPSTNLLGSFALNKEFACLLRRIFFRRPNSK